MERKQITVKSMLEPHHFKGKDDKELTSYGFIGEDGLKYETMSNTIAGYFVVDKVLECEIEDKPWSKGDVSGVNHIIKQIYIDGKPVIAPKENKPYAGGNYQKKESNNMDLECCLKTAGANALQGTSPKDIVAAAELFYQWMLNHTLTPAPSAVQSTPSPSKPQTAVNPQPSSKSAPQPKASAATLADLAEARDKGVKTKSEVMMEAQMKRGWKVSKESDFTEEQALQMIKWCKGE
jgi:hypothetical protein